MRSFNFLRSIVLAASLVTTVGGVGTAFADTMPMPHDQQQMGQSAAKASPYDSPDFTLDDSNIHN